MNSSWSSNWKRLNLIVILCALILTACNKKEPEELEGSVQVLETIDLDRPLFVQGLEIKGDKLICATGLYKQSEIGILDGGTYEVLEALPEDQFGEGLTFTEDKLFQVTWREGVCHKRDPETLLTVDTITYEGEGWGLCYDGQNIIQSDGSDTLKIRDPRTFEVLSEHKVTDRGGNPVQKINELEYANDHIYANIWMTKEIVRIDPNTFKVTKVYPTNFPADISDRNSNATLNGIAHIEGNTFYLTGKMWEAYYKVELK